MNEKKSNPDGRNPSRKWPEALTTGTQPVVLSNPKVQWPVVTRQDGFQAMKGPGKKLSFLYVHEL